MINSNVRRGETISGDYDVVAMQIARESLSTILRAVVLNDGEIPNHPERNRLVMFAVSLALRAGYEAGFRIDPKEPEWPVAYIELPTGQVSWHMPQHVKAWDGHTTPEKNQRIAAYRVLAERK